MTFLEAIATTWLMVVMLSLIPLAGLVGLVVLFIFLKWTAGQGVRYYAEETNQLPNGAAFGRCKFCGSEIGLLDINCTNCGMETEE